MLNLTICGMRTSESRSGSPQNPSATYKVSDWVLHFTYNQSAGHVKLVDYGDHDYPFELPSVDKLV